jgi:hypothetical protein
MRSSSRTRATHRCTRRARRVKTDKRDAPTLVEACRLGAYRVAHRVSPERRHVRAELAVREALVRTRTRYVSLAKALLRRDGLRVASSEAHLTAQRIAALLADPALEIGRDGGTPHLGEGALQGVPHNHSPGPDRGSWAIWRGRFLRTRAS